jgi:hypothetical protein
MIKKKKKYPVGGMALSKNVSALLENEPQVSNPHGS